jgi:hypothetical protein
VSLDVLEPATGEIVNNMHVRAARKQSIHEVGPDKRRTAGHKYLLTIPDDAPQSSRLPPVP